MSQSSSRSSASSGTSKLKCPTCRKLVAFDGTNDYRPFCSERCRESDLAAWASDTYHIPGPSLSNESDQEQDGDSEF